MLFYILNNFVTKENYLFLEILDENTDKLVNKLINQTISEPELKTLEKIYGFSLDLLDEYSIFKYPLGYLTILDLKNVGSNLLFSARFDINK